MRVISKEAARNFLVQYHNLNQSRNFVGMEGVIQCFRQIKSIQFDPLDVAGRNADLVLQARVTGYKPELLQNLLYQSHVLVDGFDKEMCIYQTEEFCRFQRVRKSSAERTIATLGHRGQHDALQLLDVVREHIKQNGPTSTKDISIGKSNVGSWGHKKLSSAALDYLWNTGELIVREKKRN